MKERYGAGWPKVRFAIWGSVVCWSVLANVRRQGGEGCCGLARGAAAEVAGGAGKGDGVLTGSRRWIEVEDLCYGEAERGHMTVVRSLFQLHWREVLACLLALVRTFYSRNVTLWRCTQLSRYR